MSDDDLRDFDALGSRERNDLYAGDPGFASRADEEEAEFEQERERKLRADTLGDDCESEEDEGDG